ncbi:MAG: EAL domain-containing protein [Rhodocyclaceae bacterium]|jgi:diguanylate cyclase (GGDEF)-like protein/PAS domain S-box-containing protein|nr:EAL domain-containing protein [Rhodocyclaceae bacterium]
MRPPRPLIAIALVLVSAVLLPLSAWGALDIAPTERLLWAISIFLVAIGALWRLNKEQREGTRRQAQGRRAEAALAGARQGIWQWDLATGSISVSSAWAYLLGYQPEEIGFSFEETFGLVHPDDQPPTREKLEAHLRGSTPDFSCEHRLLRKDGTYSWALVQGRVTERAADGAPRVMLGTLTDTTPQHEALEELRTREATLRSILTAMGEGVVMRDMAGQLVLTNQAAARIFGVDEAAMGDFARSIPQIRYRAEDGSPIPEGDLTVSRTLADGKPHEGVIGVERPNGSLAWVMARSEPVFSGDPVHQTGVVTSLTDITQLRESEEGLRLADRVFANSVEAIVITGTDGRILRVNPAFTAVTGYTPEEVLGQSPALLKSGRHDEAFYKYMWESISERGSWQGEIWNRRKDGRIYPEWLSISAVRDVGGRLSHYVAIFTDITERKAHEARIAFLAHHDPLTALPNRSLMVERIERRLLQGRRDKNHFALLFLDLDHFKHINDSLGHEVGDRLLKDIAQRLTECVRNSDSVGRLGGDEFLILLNELGDAADAGAVAEKILERMAPNFELAGHRLASSISIGISVYPGDGQNTAELMKNADTAMYHAKAAGRNTFRFFAESMNAAAMERLMLDNAMREALGRQELHLEYQPQVSLKDGRVIGMEALLRWNSKAYGTIPPTRFIPLAEDNGQIIPIGRWVLQQACRDARRWGEGCQEPVPVAVNLSALQFRRDDLVAVVSAALADSGLPPSLLELEITESLLLEQATDVQDTLARLKTLGVRVSIDDFGTGYSSLAYIKRFRVDRLKIDKSFIRDIDSDPEDAQIVRAIIQLGHTLRMEVVAEGVETPRQLAFLQEEGCETGQGYLFARPRPATEALAGIATHHVTG